MLPERPHVPSRRCPSCGQLVDPLRAPRVLWLEDGARYLCSEACRARFLLGDRNFDSPVSTHVEEPRAERPSIPDLVRGATLVRPDDEEADEERVGAHRYDLWIASGLSILAIAVAALAGRPETAWLAGVFVVGSALVNARVPLRAVRVSRIVQVVAPVGLALAAVSALATTSERPSTWPMIGLGVAALAVSIRGWVQASISSSVGRAAHELLETLPTRARVPSPDRSTYEEVPVEQLQQGDLVVVLEGELVPADGVIEQGSGVALRYPKAALSRPYDEGDFLLAGTRVLDGAVTVRVRRTGQDRGIVRAIELGRRRQLDGTAAFRLQWAVNQWSLALLGPVAIGLLLWNGLGSAAALLLGIPLIGVLASLDVPVEAAALASARRGMFFGSSRALRDGGRVGTTAILLRGALTAGEPIVQQVHRLGAVDLGELLAMAAAAERVAADHPIARAIRHYAAQHREATPPVRRSSVHPGLGVTAVTHRGTALVVGRRQLLLDQGISVATADADAAHIENEGLTPIFVALDGQLEALLAILDPTHVGARDAVQRISDLPCEVVILSGDDRNTVERIAAHLGASQVKAPLLPAERVAEVRALRETGGIIATIGRGGEDDAVLAAADVPVPLRLVGSALEDRGIAIASHDVRDAAGALWIARAARRTTWRSLGVCAVATLALLLGTAVGWMTPMAAALLGLATEAWTLRAGSRLLRRVDLRVPMQQ
ncbi:MAG: HAD family hydrolase [Deltaproteobacteria bacterium]|nr:HAD family hydrolase [Deltaproteobacteria bacterium]